MKLILVKHAETEENAAGIIQGHLPGKLSLKGIEEAKRTAETLRNEKINYIYSSDLARAVDTTKEIIKFHSGVPVEYVRELRERHWGEFQGVKKSGIDDFSVEFAKRMGAEDIDLFYSRAEGFLRKALEKHPGETILVVGHGLFNRALISAINNRGIGGIEAVTHMKGGEIRVFDVDEKILKQ